MSAKKMTTYWQSIYSILAWYSCDLEEIFGSGTFVDPEVDQRFDRNVSKIKDVIKEKLEVSSKYCSKIFTSVKRNNITAGFAPNYLGELPILWESFVQPFNINYKDQNDRNSQEF